MPNIVCSAALAKHCIESKSSTKTAKSASGDVDPRPDVNAMDLLVDAILMFPTVVTGIYEKASLSALQEYVKHVFFQEAPKGTPDSLARLIDIYVGRNFELWRDPAASKWLIQGVENALKLVESKDARVANAALIRQDRFAEGDSETLYRHLVLSDYIDLVQTLPRELLMQQHEPGLRPFDYAAPVPAVTDNPLLLFLMTLLPFVNEPNQPANNNQQ